MREIKFRVWEKVQKVMLYNGFSLDENGSVSFYWNILPIHSAHAILMQFTGLKDKNGKEIYHSDLLMDSDGRIWVVDFGDNDMDSTIASWTIQPVKPKGKRYPVDKVIAKFEIIGNIYDNPLPSKGN